MTAHAEPTVLIVGVSIDVAPAIEEVVALAHCRPLASEGVPSFRALQPPPAAIVAQVRRTSVDDVRSIVEHWPAAKRPTLVALVATDEDASAADGLGCDVVLREPWQIRALYDTLHVIYRSYER